MPNEFVPSAKWLRHRWLLMGLTHEGVGERSGLSVRTVERIEAGHVPSDSTILCLMHPLGYGRDVADRLMEGQVDPGELDALSSPVDSPNRYLVIPAAHRRRSIFFRDAGRGLPPYVRTGAMVTCSVGPVQDGNLALVELASGRRLVRFVRGVSDGWLLLRSPRAKRGRLLKALAVSRVSTVLFESRAVNVVAKLVALLLCPQALWTTC